MEIENRNLKEIKQNNKNYHKNYKKKYKQIEYIKKIPNSIQNQNLKKVNKSFRKKKEDILLINLNGKTLKISNLCKIDKISFFRKIDKFFGSLFFSEEKKIVLYISILKKIEKCPNIFCKELLKKKTDHLISIIVSKNI